MTTERHLERDLPQILGDLAMGPYPDYIDDVLATTAQRRQRAAWTFPERWLPMVDIARQPVLTPRLPWRSISFALLAIALLLAAAAVFIGSQPRLPAPFGVARNGLIAYAADGDIYVVDPVMGVATAVVTGPDTDLDPKFSLDGTRLVFERKEGGRFGPGRLYVADADGSGLTLLTPEPLSSVESYAFSPDGREILISATIDNRSTILITVSDGTAIRPLPLPADMVASEPEYRPPNGEELVFVGRTDGPRTGLYIARPDGTGLRALVEPPGLIVDDPRWSPDGSRIAYTSWAVDYASGGRLARVNMVSAADGRTDQILGPHPLADIEGYPAWSNDGTRLVITRCVSADANVTDGACQAGYAVVPADGSGPGVDIEWAEPDGTEDVVHYQWAPDDTTIVTTVVDSQGQPLPGSQFWDPTTGQPRPIPWSIGAASWQRLAH